MPEINGFDFLKTIRAEQNTKDLPVIVISAATDIENKKKAAQLGANSFLDKPIDIEILLEEMQKILN
jgi:two-component system chemotaxis response regulator CheY